MILGLRLRKLFPVNREPTQICWGDQLGGCFYGAECVRQTFRMVGLSNLVWMALSWGFLKFMQPLQKARLSGYIVLGNGFLQIVIRENQNKTDQLTVWCQE